MIFRPETIVASYLHSMVLLPKVLFNQRSLFPKWAVQNNWDALVVAHIKLKMKITHFELILTHSL